MPIHRLTPLAIGLRRSSTDAERLLWGRIRAGRLSGHKFRRQQPLGQFVVEFVCLESRLVIELDGGQHAVHTDADWLRDRWLKQRGFRALRFWNNDVMQNLVGVLQKILDAVSPSPQPSPVKGEGAV